MSRITALGASLNRNDNTTNLTSSPDQLEGCLTYSAVLAVAVTLHVTVTYYEVDANRGVYLQSGIRVRVMQSVFGVS